MATLNLKFLQLSLQDKESSGSKMQKSHNEEQRSRFQKQLLEMQVGFMKYSIKKLTAAKLCIKTINEQRRRDCKANL